MAESFFATFKNKLIYRHPWPTRGQDTKPRSSPGSKDATTGAGDTLRSACSPRSNSRPQHDTLPPRQRDPCPPGGGETPQPARA